MLKKNAAAIFFLAGALAALPAAARAACVPSSVVRGAIQVQTLDSGAEGCAILIAPADPAGLVFRQYLLDGSGLFMVFDSVSGPEDSSTGARSYFFFPRRKSASYRFLNDGRLEVGAASGQAFFFSPKTARLESVPGVSYAEDPMVSMNNNGGVEISRAGGVWLDTGWQTGSASFAHPERTSVFHDAVGNSCPVSNADVFTNDKNGNPSFNFQTAAALALFLRRNCPLLDASSLTTGPAAAAFPIFTTAPAALAAYQAALSRRAR